MAGEPARHESTLPWLTAEQMAEVDRAMVQDYAILLPQMMELAGRHLADLARQRFLAGASRAGSAAPVVVLAGKGGNGGGALVCARRLAGWGFDAAVVLAAAPRQLGEVPAHQFNIAQRMAIPVLPVGTAALASAALIVDGLLGYGVRGNPRGAIADLIRRTNQGTAPILALDLPSGLDATSGQPGDPTVRATATMTLALPKQGLREPTADPFVGELYLADIGVPADLYTRPPLGLARPRAFERADRIRLR